MLRLYITVASLVRRIDSRLQSSKTKAGCSLDDYIHLAACESVTVAKAPRGKETRASCSSAKSILAPPRQVSETRKPYNAELKTDLRDVDSVCILRVRHRPISSDPATLSALIAAPSEFQPWLLSRTPHLSILVLYFSLPSRNREVPASVPRQTPSYGRTVASTCQLVSYHRPCSLSPSFASTAPCIRTARSRRLAN